MNLSDYSPPGIRGGESLAVEQGRNPLVRGPQEPTMAQRLAVRQAPEASPVMHQTWEDLLFLHWEWDPLEIQRTLPPGLFVDTFHGRAYMGVVPFFVREVRPNFLPAIPGISEFLEMNVQTYVYDAMCCSRRAGQRDASGRRECITRRIVCAKRR